MRRTFETPLPRREHFASVTRHIKLLRLLVPVDFTPATLPALRFAATLAEHFGSNLYLLHVIEEHHIEGESAVVVAKLDAELDQEAVEQLERVAREELPPHVPVIPLVRRGKPAHEILNAAEALDADLIVLATHKRSALGRLLWGSTAPRVERHAPCPLLVIRCENESATETVFWRETEAAADRFQPQPAT